MITSTSNPRIKALARLKRRSDRDALQRFVIEGSRPVARAHAAGWPLLEAYFAPGLATDEAARTADLLQGAAVALTELGDDAFRKIAYRQHPDGILAIAPTQRLDLDGLTLPPRTLVLVVEAIEKPGNLGAMLRTADGAGVDAVIAADPSTDLFNPNVVRASQGALFAVPLAVATTTACAAWLDQHGVTVLAAGPGKGAAPWAYALAEPTAIVIGSEHDGLSAVWDRYPRVTLPMAGDSDSLNASTAAAIILYEAVRQRS